MKVEVDVLGSPVPNSPYRLCGRKATLNCSISELRSREKVEVDVLGSPVPNSPYGLCGRQATLNLYIAIKAIQASCCRRQAL